MLMKNNRNTKILYILTALLLPCLFVASCGKNSFNGNIIVTRTSGNLRNPNFVNGESWRFPEHAQIVAIDKEEPLKAVKILTPGFYSACAPDISYDGRFMLFAGQQKKGDAWRIWELDLNSLKSRVITSPGGNCTDPVYLPGKRLTFSRMVENDSLKAGESLYTGNLDGTDLSRITFDPAAFFASSTLADGRILSAGRRIYPDTGAQKLMVMRPDGTKAELFYLPPQKGTICSRSRETGDGKVVFIESGKGTGDDGSLVSINYNRPLHTRINLSSDIPGNFLSVLPLRSGRYLVCYRKSGTDKYGLYEFDPEKRTLGKSIYESTDFNILDAVEDKEHTRPRKLPSEVDLHVKSGLLLCQNINVINPAGPGRAAVGVKAVKIEILGINRSLGTVNVEADGSFYIKPLADTPFRIRTLDENGKVINEPCSWIYLRPNERRGCVGCHEDMELTPENRIALAIKKQPVIVPVHIAKIKEKKVELK